MRIESNIHKAVLLQILKEVYTDTSLGPVLGLKGGTAAYLVYDLGRFSVDLDLLDERKEDYVFGKIETILKGFGTIRERYKKHHTLFFLLSYSEEAHNIKVEISRRKFDSQYEIKNYLGISMLVMVKEDMFAHKLVALLERGKTANRDIFDVWFFLKNNWPINTQIVEKRTGLPFKVYLKKCIDFLEGYSDRYILAGIGELLDEKQKAWVKSNLKKDVLFLLKIKYEIEK
jgi:predicted nucleotidyltransferase component of viral defense system